MRRALAAFSLFAVVLASCGGGGAAAGPSNDLTITMTEFKFDPVNPTVNAGQPIKLRVKNAGTVEHDIVIDKAGVNLLVKAGASAAKEIPAPAAGTYDIVCSIAGHKEAGMVGKLIVK